MIVLVGYIFAGSRIVVMVPSGPQWADVGCLGNRVLLQVRATMVAAQAMTRGEAVGWSRALNESSTIVI